MPSFLTVYAARQAQAKNAKSALDRLGARNALRACEPLLAELVPSAAPSSPKLRRIALPSGKVIEVAETGR
jgi:hypothetical protein